MGKKWKSCDHIIVKVWLKKFENTVSIFDRRKAVKMVVPNITMDPRKHISDAIWQNNIIKLLFQKLFVYYLFIIIINI